MISALSWFSWLLCHRLLEIEYIPKSWIDHEGNILFPRNGDRYAGEYFGDKIHGFGVYHFANGHCYEGSWHEGRKQGYGMYTFRNGDVRCGEWDSGNLKTPSNLQIDGVLRAVKVKYNNISLPLIEISQAIWILDILMLQIL